MCRILYKDLLEGSAKDLLETLYRDLAKRPSGGILYRDHRQRRAPKILTQGTYTGCLPPVLPQRCLENDLAQELLRRSCQGDLAQDLVHRNLQNLPGYLSVMFFATLFGVSCRGIVRAVPLSHVMSGSIASLTQKQVVSRWCLGGALVAVSLWCPAVNMLESCCFFWCFHVFIRN